MIMLRTETRAGRMCTVSVAHCVSGVTFAENSRLSGDGWRALLSGLSFGVEGFSFRDCGLDDEKAKAIGEEMSRFAELKKLD